MESEKVKYSHEKTAKKISPFVRQQKKEKIQYNYFNNLHIPCTFPIMTAMADRNVEGRADRT